MKSFLKKNKYYFILLSVFFLCELIVNPTGQFPLNDDWSYAKSVLKLLNEGKYDLGEWPAMTLVVHLFWGLLFAKAGGFSFFVLRLSTLVSSFIGICLLFKLMRKITGKPLIAFMASLVLLFNPIYFNLSNTFMTDVTFNTLLLLCCYFAYEFFETQKFLYFFLVLFCSVFLVLTRQFGLIVPVSFMLACLLLSKNKWKYVAGAFVGLVLVVGSLKLYEYYLHQILPANGAYKYSGNINITQRIFWDNFFINLARRYTTIIMHVLVYTFPLTVVYLYASWRGIKWQIRISAMVFVAALTWLLFRNEPFPMGNIFINFDVGTETFFESMSRDTTRPMEHNGSAQMENLMHGIRDCFIALSALMFVFAGIKLYRQALNKIKSSPYIVFLISLVVTYTGLVLITESYFDRYHLPLISLFIILFAYPARKVEVKLWPAWIIIGVMGYAAVFGTRDYFAWNEKRWEAYYYLIKKEGVNRDKINAGFEPCCWNEGQPSWWYLMFELKRYDYLVQYWQEPGFKLYKEFPFRRWFLPRQDKINIFVRDTAEVSKH